MTDLQEAQQRILEIQADLKSAWNKVKKDNDVETIEEVHKLIKVLFDEQTKLNKKIEVKEKKFFKRYEKYINTDSDD